MVESDRAARRERVAEPEVVLERDLVGDVGEGRGALVGRDDEVGVVGVVAHHARGRHRLAVDEVVGELEQRADERPVAGDDLGRERVAVGRRRLDDEPALGADRHDDRVLHRLRLHQAEDLGAEVFAAVGPADAAARDAPGSQVHAFDAR